MNPYPPTGVPAFVFWLMPDEDPQYEEWPLATPLHAWQRGRCAMCQVSDWIDSRLVMDHDHATGKIRGLLCRGCNISEPNNGSPKFEAWRAGMNPATILGIDEEYDYLMPGQRVLERQSQQEVSDSDLDLIAAAVAE